MVAVLAVDVVFFPYMHKSAKSHTRKIARFVLTTRDCTEERDSWREKRTTPETGGLQ